MTAPTDRTRALLEGPILPTLLRLTGPNVAVIGAQAAANFMEAWFIGQLGVDALAGAALVFPLVMLMQMMSAGGVGGGISAAIARALGGGRREDAVALVFHAFLIALALGGTFSLLAVVFGPRLYAAMGGEGASLRAALDYSNAVFAGAALLWILNCLASALRGSGNMALPARVLTGGLVLLVPVSAALVFGFGPVPALGIAGAGLAMVLYYLGGSVVLVAALIRGQGPLRLDFPNARFAWRHVHEILRVGIFGIANTTLMNLTVVVLTGIVGAYGPAAIAGYGLGARLEYFMIPLAFGVGAALNAMVGANIGAGATERARRVGLTGGLLAAAVAGGIGLAVAIEPLLWLALFTDDPSARAMGGLYFRIVGPTFAFFGLGLALYFAAQGLGRMWWAFAGGVSRAGIAVLGGGLVVAVWPGEPAAIFVVAALGLVVYGSLNLVTWRR